MYEKAWVNGEVLYFVHSPPRPEDAPESHRGPKAPTADTPKYMRSVYYYWWAFLRESPEYVAALNGAECRPEIGTTKSAFGDIRPDDFRGWWMERGAFLFAEPEPEPQIQIVEQGTFPDAGGDAMVLAVPLAADLERTLKEIRTILAPAFAARRAEHGHFSRSRFPVEGKFKLSALDETLRLHQARARHPDHDLWALPWDADLHWGVEPKSADAVDKTRLRDRASKALARSKALIANVAEGRFPDFATIKDKPRLQRERFDPEEDW